MENIPGGSTALNPGCSICGRKDETLRYISYPYVFSIIIRTYRRYFSGLWCSRHRWGNQLKASLITVIVGWLGIPFGFLFTPVALFQLARGGLQDKEKNSGLLASIGDEKMAAGDYSGAYKCYEESLRLKDNDIVQGKLARIYSLPVDGRSVAGASKGIIGFIFLPLVFYLLASLVGFLDRTIAYGLSGVDTGGNIFVDILTWVPLVLLMFLILLVLVSAIRKVIQVSRCSQNILASVFAFVASILNIFGVASGESFGIFVSHSFHGLEFSSPLDFLVSLGAVLTRGWNYFFQNLISDKSTYAVIMIVLLFLIAVLFLAVTVPVVMDEAEFQKKRNRLQEGTYSNEIGDRFSIPLLGGLVALIALIGLGYSLFPQKGTLDSLESYHAIYTGDNHLKNGEYTEALADYTKASQLRPNTAIPYERLGVVYYNTNNIQKSIQAYQKAIFIKPTYEDAHIELGWVYLNSNDIPGAKSQFNQVLQMDSGNEEANAGSGWANLYLGYFDDSVSDFDKALSRNPQRTDAYVGKGAALMYKNDLTGAEQAIRKAIELKPDEASNYIYLSDIFLFRNNGKDAIDPLQKALEIDPKNYDALQNLGKALTYSGRVDEAIDSYKKAILLQPENPSAMIGIGFAYMQKGDYPSALDYFQKALKLQPDSGEYHADLALLNYSLGNSAQSDAELKLASSSNLTTANPNYYLAATLARVNRFADAEKYFLEAIRLSQTVYLPGLYADLGYVYSSEGKFDLANEYIEESIAADSKFSDSYVTKAFINIDEQRLDLASTAIDQALELTPDAHLAFAVRSFLDYQSGNLDGAVTEARKAISLYKYDSYSYTRLAFALHDQGNLAEATSAAEEAVRLAPTSALPHYILGLCYKDGGINDKAVTEFQKFLEYYWDRAYIRDFKTKAEQYLIDLTGKH